MNDSSKKISLNNSLCLLIEDQDETRDFISNSLNKNFPGMEIIAMKNIREAQSDFLFHLVHLSNHVQ